MDTLYGHTDWIRSLAILSDLKLASGSSDRTIKIWNTTTGIIIQTLNGHSGTVRCLASFNSGKNLISGSEDRTIKIWDLTYSKVVRTLTVFSFD